MNKKFFTEEDLKEAFYAGYELKDYEIYIGRFYIGEKVDWKPNYSTFEE